MGLRDKASKLFHDTTDQIERFSESRKNSRQDEHPYSNAQHANQQYLFNRPPPPLPPRMSEARPQVRPYWQCTFQPSKPIEVTFEHQHGAGGWGNDEKQTYTSSPANSFHTTDGKLVLRAITNHAAINKSEQFTSARLVSHDTLNRDRGYLHARLTPPIACGIWPAFWLLPKEPYEWPYDGEIDIMETWNADPTNHSCLHWGHYNAKDSQKHKVINTPISDFARPFGHDFGFAWDQQGEKGRLVWYINGRPVMRAAIAPKTRPLRTFQIIINVAMGGNVCDGVVPANGCYDMVVHEISFCEEPMGGWQEFDRIYAHVPEGHGC